MPNTQLNPITNHLDLIAADRRAEVQRLDEPRATVVGTKTGTTGP